MSLKARWTIIFLTLTLVPIGLEVFAAVDHNPNVMPWTYYISHYIPWPISLAAFLILALWLPWHFWKAYHQAKAQWIQHGSNWAFTEAEKITASAITMAAASGRSAEDCAKAIMSVLHSGQVRNIKLSKK